MLYFNIYGIIISFLKVDTEENRMCILLTEENKMHILATLNPL